MSNHIMVNKLKFFSEHYLLLKKNAVLSVPKSVYFSYGIKKFSRTPPPATPACPYPFHCGGYNQNYHWNQH